MENLGFATDEPEPPGPEVNLGNDDAERIVEAENDELRELPLEPYSRVLYVATWPVLKIRDFIDTHWCRIKIICSYILLIAWLIYLIVSMIKSDFLRALPLFTLTMVALLYTNCRKPISKAARKVFESCARNEKTTFYFKIVFGIVIFVMLLIMLIYQVVTNPICLQSLLGLFIIPLFATLCSSDPSRIQIRPVLFGLAFQVALGLVCFQFPPGRAAVVWFGQMVESGIEHAYTGAEFFFDDAFHPTSLAFGVMPIILFMSIVISLAFYVGLIPAFLDMASTFVSSCLGITSPEALSVLGSMFLGQVETLMLIGPMLHKLTPSELVTSLGAGFGSIAGSVLFAYIAMGVSAFDLLTATLTAVPATIVISKLVQPEIYFSRFAEGNVKEIISKENQDDTLLGAAMTGAHNGCKVILQVSLVLIGFYSVLSLVDSFVTYVFVLADIDQQLGSLESVLGVVFTPVAFMIGVPGSESLQVGRLIATKLIFNEFVAFQRLLDDDTLSARAVQLSTFSIASFANFCAVAVVISAAPKINEQLKNIEKFAWKGLLVGFLSSLFNATVAGLIHPLHIDHEFNNTTT